MDGYLFAGKEIYGRPRCLEGDTDETKECQNIREKAQTKIENGKQVLVLTYY